MRHDLENNNIKHVTSDVNQFQEYSVQLTFREQWQDERLKFNDFGGRLKYLTLTEASRVWMPDLFFSNEKEGHFHNIIMPNVYIRIHPHGSVLYSIRWDYFEKLVSNVFRFCIRTIFQISIEYILGIQVQIYRSYIFSWNQQKIWKKPTLSNLVTSLFKNEHKRNKIKFSEYKLINKRDRIK